MRPGHDVNKRYGWGHLALIMVKMLVLLFAAFGATVAVWMVWDLYLRLGAQ
jgi:hypothetical protein